MQTQQVLILLLLLVALCAFCKQENCQEKLRKHKETLGGQVLETVYRQVKFRNGSCVWISYGKSDSRYTETKETGCRRCMTLWTGYSFCSSLPEIPQDIPRELSKNCKYELGLDCKHHLVDYQNIAKTCAFCLTKPRRMRQVLGGKVINQMEIQLRKNNACHWVLNGSTCSQGKYTYSQTHTKSCVSCTHAAGQKEQCISIPWTRKENSALCKLVVGFDCKTYLVNAADEQKECIADSKCKQQVATIKHTLWGLELKQTLVNMRVGGRCHWMLAGSSRASYTYARSREMKSCHACVRHHKREVCEKPARFTGLPHGCVWDYGIDCKPYFYHVNNPFQCWKNAVEKKVIKIANVIYHK